ncbi:MAG: tetratricopeptide repeat protein, partial [Wenzhouxiangellaceae bacterium]
PFRGLEAFEFEHAPVFFGRTKAVSDILQALRSQAAEARSFVLVLGMSGGGKSSVVRAGVLPMLTRPGVIEGVDVWRRAVFRPTDVRGDLFTGLAKALLRENALPSLDEDQDGPGELAQVLRNSPQAAASMIKGALSREKRKNGEKADARLALLIDQMEEMYTQHEVTQADREAFVDVLDALARCGRVWVIGTLRSDFYQAVGKIRKLVALKEGDGQYDLLPPTASEIGQMIRLPTRAAGLRFEEDPASSDRLDDMLRDAAAEHPEVLPLLQFTLEELYQRRTEDGILTLAAYRDLGGVEGSLAQRAETIFKDLPDDVEAELPKVLNALVSIERDGYEQIGRKRAPLTDATTGKSHELIETFVRNRLFVTELADDGTAVVTVAHEALLWHWPRVKDWVAQNRENLRIRGRIATAAGRWKMEEQPSDLLLPSGKPLVEAESLLEQDLELSADEFRFINASIARAKRMQRLKAGVVAALAVLGVIATFSAYLATQQRDIANQARSRAVVEAEIAKQTTDFMVDLFNVADPGEARGNSITAREIMDKGASRIEQELKAQPAIQATLMETMGTVYMSLGLYDQSASLLQSALDKRRALFGENHLEVARSMHRLGDVLKLKAAYGPALQNYRDALAMRRDLLGDEHSETASTMFELADLLGRMGDFPGGETLYREALAIQRNLLGAENAEVARSLEGLGLNLFDQGNTSDGVSLLREAVAMQRKLHNGPHPDLAEALNNLGFVTPDNKEAENLFREALAMKRVLYSNAPHPEIAMGLNNVAYTLHVASEYKEAELLYREAIEMNRKLLGNDHPDIAMALNNLAFVIRQENDLDSTIEMARESLATYRRTLGDEHPSIARGMSNLAMWLLEDGDYEAAEPLLRDSLELRISLLGEEHSEVAGTKILLAGLLVDTGRNDEALEFAAATREIYTREYGADHWRTASAAAAEGAALASLGRPEEARKLLLRGYELLRSNTDALPWFVNSAARWRAKIT